MLIVLCGLFYFRMGLMLSSRVAVMLLVVTLLQGRPDGEGLVRCQPAVINRSVPSHQISIKGLTVCWGFYVF